MRRLSVLPLVIGILFFTGLEVWPAHAATNIGIIVGGTTTDKQGQYRWSSMRIKGTVWLDENVDGIRQSSEPVLPGSHMIFGVEGPKYRGLYEKVEYKVRAFYLKPGAELVKDAITFQYSHSGCAHLVIPPEKAGRVRLTVDIRVVSNKVRHLLPLSWPLVDGHFFREAAQPSISQCDAGFAVTNADGIPFWDTWQRLGLENVGYPISNRYVWRGLVIQAFQKAIMQWRPGKGVFFVNVFDELHDAGKDDVLRVRWATPPALVFDPMFDLIAWDWDEAAKWSLDFLDENEAIKERYFASPDPLLQYGLPTSRVEDMGDHYAIRTQGAVFQQWKEDVPWAKAGEVTIANAGEIAKALDATCESTVTGSKTCTHLFFSEKPLRNQDPIPLIPQHVDLIGIGLP